MNNNGIRLRSDVYDYTVVVYYTPPPADGRKALNDAAIRPSVHLSVCPMR